MVGDDDTDATASATATHPAWREAVEAGGLNAVWLAQSKLRRRRFDECIEICSDALGRNPYDQAAWYLKCRALTLKAWIDDTELDGAEGAGDALLDEGGVVAAHSARPGTSLAAAGLAAGGGSGIAPSAGMGRPMSSAMGRPVTGFARAGTSGGGRPGTGGARPGTGANVRTALRGTAGGNGGGARPGTARPVTASGRFVRLGTASLAAEPGGPFINAARLDLKKYAARPALAR